MRSIRWIRPLLLLAAIAVGTGCHREVEEVPLLSRTIGISDKFYDVQALSADHAVVIGYGGKILTTTDGGFTWSQTKPEPIAPSTGFASSTPTTAGFRGRKA